jgi:hypothetical protein
MTSVYLLASTFSLVFLLGIQQLNVQGQHTFAAFCTSIAIGGAQLALFKLAPDAGGMEIAAYLAGGPLGIVAAMRAHPILADFWRGKR